AQSEDFVPSPTMQPQVAPLGPLVADQIDLDPSVTETPALPVSKPLITDEPLPAETIDELRLSATLARPTQPIVPDPQQLELPRQAFESLADQPESRPQSAFPPTKAWPYPGSLIEQLNVLGATTPIAASWSEQVKLEIERLVQSDSLADSGVTTELTLLRRLADDAKPL